MSIYQKIGIAIIILAIGMLYLRTQAFSADAQIDPIITGLGMFSYVFWFPTVIIGIVLLCIGKLKERPIR